MNDRTSLMKYAWLSLGAAVLTMGLKAVGYLLTQSVGLLSDALESGINLVAAFTALTALHISAQPPDEDHAYGHQKVEYLSSGAEGGLILLAAIAIAVMAIQRLLNPQPIDHLSIGLLISAAASVINLVTALILIRVGRRERSIALEADGQHLMSDVWTSVGVLIGVGAVGITGWQILDPLVALIVAGWIGYNGFKILKRSALGLIDTALPEQDVAAIQAILERNGGSETKYHALRTRQAGSRSFISMHIQTPGDWSIQEGHDLLETIEREIREVIPSATVFTHIEPLEDPRSWIDQDLDRSPETNLPESH
ncbi:MAG: cation diffusion facilitator family transporter [Anaerolineales bacterium]|nr:cation diffusion facilitator family transporter [Anaerolineales bacterium]